MELRDGWLPTARAYTRCEQRSWRELRLSLRRLLERARSYFWSCAVFHQGEKLHPRELTAVHSWARRTKGYGTESVRHFALPPPGVDRSFPDPGLMGRG